MEVGPISPFNGFPVWYKDENGLRLQLNDNPADPFSGLTPADLPNPSQPVSFPDNYPEEAFYMLAEAEMTTGTGERARLVLALEAAFAADVPRQGDQIVFGRVRIRIFGLQPNTEYKITHPYGVDTFVAELDDEDDQFAEINVTEDIGSGDFELALTSRVHPFLTWDPSVAPAAPQGYIGDPGIDHPIIGSPFLDEFGQPQNIFRIEGPGIGVGSPDRATTPGLNPDNCIETRNFSLLGKISTISGVDITRATYEQNDASGGMIDVFASTDSDPNLSQDIEVTGIGLAQTPLQGRNGRYFARVSFTGEAPPNEITVTNVSDEPDSTKIITPVDFITGSANYHTDTSTLTIEAQSSDAVHAPSLIVLDFGLGELTIPSTGILSTNFPISPASVTIRSTLGGERTIPVTITGQPTSSFPVVADAGEDSTALIGSEVTLNGTNSTGVITLITWIQLAGPEVILVGANTLTPTFTAPNTQATLTFQLTIEGEGGTSTDTVTVSVLTDVPAPIANAGPDRTVLQGSVVTLEGTVVSGIATQYLWEQLSGPPVQLTNANTPTATFTFPKLPEPLAFQFTATGPGGSSTDEVTLSTGPDNLTVNRVEFRTRDAEWRIRGTSDVFGPGVAIKIFIGNALEGTLLAEVQVDELGQWEYRVEPSNIQPDSTRAISIQSTSGGTLMNVPINIRQ